MVLSAAIQKHIPAMRVAAEEISQNAWMEHRLTVAQVVNAHIFKTSLRSYAAPRLSRVGTQPALVFQRSKSNVTLMGVSGARLQSSKAFAARSTSIAIIGRERWCDHRVSENDCGTL